MRYPTVPKILQSVPSNLADMTDGQWDASVLWYSKLPLRELRERQSIVASQQKYLYESGKSRFGKWPQTKDALYSRAWSNLQILESILTEAVMKKEFKSNPRLNLRKQFTYKEIGRGIDFDGWYKIELLRSDGKIIKVNKKRYAELRRQGRVK